MNDQRQLISRLVASRNKGWGLCLDPRTSIRQPQLAENIGSLSPLTIHMNIKKGKSRNRDGTQDIGLCVLPEPTMLWIGQRRPI